MSLWMKNGKLIANSTGNPIDCEEYCPCTEPVPPGPGPSPDPDDPDHGEMQLFASIADIGMKDYEEYDNIGRTIQSNQLLDIRTKDEYSKGQIIFPTVLNIPRMKSITHNGFKYLFTTPLTKNGNNYSCEVIKIDNTSMRRPQYISEEIDDDYSFYQNNLCGIFVVDSSIEGDDDPDTETVNGVWNNGSTDILFGYTYIPYKVNENNSKQTLNFTTEMNRGSLISSIYISNTNDDIVTNSFHISLVKKGRVSDADNQLDEKYFNINPAKKWLQKDYFLDRLITGYTNAYAYYSLTDYSYETPQYITNLEDNYYYNFVYNNVGKVYKNEQGKDCLFFYYNANSYRPVVSTALGFKYFNSFTQVPVPNNSNVIMSVISTITVGGVKCSGFTLGDSIKQLIPNKKYLIYQSLPISNVPGWGEGEESFFEYPIQIEYPQYIRIYNDETIFTIHNLSTGWFFLSGDGTIFKLEEDEDNDQWNLIDLEGYNQDFNIPFSTGINRNPPPHYFYDNAGNNFIYGTSNDYMIFSSYYFQYEYQKYLINKNFFDSEYGYLLLPQKYLDFSSKDSTRIQESVSAQYYKDLQKLSAINQNYSLYVGDVHDMENGPGHTSVDSISYNGGEKYAWDNITSAYNNSQPLSTVPLNSPQYFFYNHYSNTIQQYYDTTYIYQNHVNGGTGTWSGQDIENIVKFIITGANTNYTGVRCQILTAAWVFNIDGDSSKNIDGQPDYNQAGYKSIGVITANFALNQYYQLGYSLFSLGRYNNDPIITGLFDKTFNSNSTLNDVRHALGWEDGRSTPLRLQRNFMSNVIIRPIQLLTGNVSDPIVDQFKFLEADICDLSQGQVFLYQKTRNAGPYVLRTQDNYFFKFD